VKMPRSQVKCPRCQQPAIVEIEQIFDVTTDPQAKQRFLGGLSNHINCQSCGYSGMIATPILYHDNEKGLLLSFFPPDLNIPLNEQEKIIGPMINKIVNNLPPEKRKAYLFSPKSFLTYESMIESILGADGITPEMIKAQQNKANLIEKLLSATSDDSLKAIIKEESSLIDAEFFALFSRLMESAIGSQQEDIGNRMERIQQLLLEETEYGKKIAEQSEEIQEAVKTLQAAGKDLTREKLIDILLEAPNDTRLSVLVSYTRQGLDYQFFQLLTDRIDKSKPESRTKLELLRSKLLEITNEIDKQIEIEQKHAVELLNEILESDNIAESIAQHLGEINDNFIQLLNLSANKASEGNDQSLIEKYNQVITALQQYSTPPPEYALLQELIDAPDEKSLEKLCSDHADEFNDDFIQLVSGIVAKAESDADIEQKPQEKITLEKIKVIYRKILQISMKKNMG